MAGIDVHKRRLAVVVTDVAGDGQFALERRQLGVLDGDLREWAQWLADGPVREAVMESTAQYWRPVWRQREGQCPLHWAQAPSNRAPRGRQQDCSDAERLVRRQVAGEWILSWVPDAAPRLWRTITHTQYPLTCDRVRLQNQLEAFLEDTHLQLGSLVSDLLGVSSRRILQALSQGESHPEVWAALGEGNWKATPQQRADAWRAAGEMSRLQRQILKLSLERVDRIERHLKILDRQIATALRPYQQAVMRLAAIPGYGVDSAQQVIAEVGPEATACDAPEPWSSWVGVCPGREESAGVARRHHSPKGHRRMRRILVQVAHAAVQSKGSLFPMHDRRQVGRLGQKRAIWAIAHRICRLTWIILHRANDYIEYGAARSALALKKRTAKQIRQLRALGYQIISPTSEVQLA